MAKIKGKCKWAYVKNLDTKYDPMWKITVFCDLEEAKKMKALGLKVTKVDEDMEPELAELGKYSTKLTRRETKRGKAAGQKNDPPEVIDADNEEFTEILGDGSEVIVTFGTYQWNNSHGSGTGVDLQKVKVINLVEYVPADKEEEASDTPSSTGGTPAVDDDIPF